MNFSLDNIVPQWLLPCSCTQTRCHCNARLKPDILCAQGIPYNGTPPLHLDPNIKIQFIEFTYTNNQFAAERIQRKINKFTPLMNELRQQGWTTPLILILTGGARGTTHTLTFQALHKQLHLPKDAIKSTLTSQYYLDITSCLHHPPEKKNRTQPTPPSYTRPTLTLQKTIKNQTNSTLQKDQDENHHLLMLA